MRGRRSQEVPQPISLPYAALVKGRNETPEDTHSPEELETQKKRINSLLVNCWSDQVAYEKYVARHKNRNFTSGSSHCREP